MVSHGTYPTTLLTVIAGLVPAIHAFDCNNRSAPHGRFRERTFDSLPRRTAWMAGTSPAMTLRRSVS